MVFSVIIIKTVEFHIKSKTNNKPLGHAILAGG